MKNLYQILKDQFEYGGTGIKPVKATGTRWIDHQLREMQRLVNKFGLYCQQLQSLIPKIKSSKDRATLQGKFNKLIDAKVLLCSALFSKVTSTTKLFFAIR